jgi:hypothetical protein
MAASRNELDGHTVLADERLQEWVGEHSPGMPERAELQMTGGLTFT